jgi:hypothetical protein
MYVLWPFFLCTVVPNLISHGLIDFLMMACVSRQLGKMEKTSSKTWNNFGARMLAHDCFHCCAMNENLLQFI